MAIYNLQAIAEQTRYLEQQGMSREEAEKKALDGYNLDQDQLTGDMRTTLDRLYNNEHSQTLRNEDGDGDKDRLIDRRQAGSMETYDANPQETQITEE